MILERPATRAELAQIALAMRARGALLQEIADGMGISYSYAQTLVADPTGEKDRARKDRYRKPCPNCGRLMDGSNGANAPSQCAQCAKENPPNRVWTRELVIERIQEWTERFGQPPTANDWGLPRPDGGVVRPELLAYYRASNFFYPQVSTVQKLFGTWGRGIEAAGFARPYSGTRRPRKDTSRARTPARADHERTPPVSTTAHDATLTHDCTVPGCDQEAHWTRGLYAGLCEVHARAKRSDPHPRRNGAPPVSDGLEAKVKELGRLGKTVDRKRVRAEKLTRQALTAKAEADAAEEAFQRRARELMGQPE